MFQYKDMRFTLLHIMRILRFGNFANCSFHPSIEIKTLETVLADFQYMNYKIEDVM